MWRPADEHRVLLMVGRTTGYTTGPRGEYVLGIVDGKPMRSRGGREHRLFLPGQLVAWDPSNAHTGAAINDQPSGRSPAEPPSKSETRPFSRRSSAKRSSPRSESSGSPGFFSIGPWSAPAYSGSCEHPA
jgi:hypothetical protein